MSRTQQLTSAAAAARMVWHSSSGSCTRLPPRRELAPRRHSARSAARAAARNAAGQRACARGLQCGSPAASCNVGCTRPRQGQASPWDTRWSGATPGVAGLRSRIGGPACSARKREQDAPAAASSSTSRSSWRSVAAAAPRVSSEASWTCRGAGEGGVGALGARHPS